MPTCQLEQVSDPRVLFDGYPDGYSWLGQVVAGPSAVGVYRTVSDEARYVVLDRASGAPLADYLTSTAVSASGGDDLVLQSATHDDPYLCRTEADIVIFEGFEGSRLFGHGEGGYRDLDDLGTTVDRLAVGERVVLSAGIALHSCPPATPSNEGWYWVFPRDGTGTPRRAMPEQFFAAGLVHAAALAERDGRGFLLLKGSEVWIARPDGSHQVCCPLGHSLCLLQFSEEAVPLSADCLRDSFLGFNPFSIALAAGRSTVLAAWWEETGWSGWRVKALRLADGMPAEVLSDGQPSWRPYRGTSPSGIAWAKAGDGFAVVGEWGEPGSLSRGIVLLDEAAEVMQQVAMEELPAPEDRGLFGGIEYAIAATDTCIDVAWDEEDRREPPEPGYRYRILTQSFCCARSE